MDYCTLGSFPAAQTRHSISHLQRWANTKGRRGVSLKCLDVQKKKQTDASDRQTDQPTSSPSQKCHISKCLATSFSSSSSFEGRWRERGFSSSEVKMPITVIISTKAVQVFCDAAQAFVCAIVSLSDTETIKGACSRQGKEKSQNCEIKSNDYELKVIIMC